MKEIAISNKPPSRYYGNALIGGCAYYEAIFGGVNGSSSWTFARHEVAAHVLCNRLQG